mmetsp:Transcript_38244/g.113660  ORF Transcript_38244/g.113660 Transcript_38244/m.113660 type:complete len:284 (-) Transcript_38244:228-1079(-)
MMAARQSAARRQERPGSSRPAVDEGGEEGCAIGRRNGRPGELALAPGARVAGAVLLALVLACAVLFASEPLPDKDVPIGVGVDTTAVALAIAHRALVERAIRESPPGLAVLDPATPPADVRSSSLGRPQRADPISHSSGRATDIHVTRRQERDAEALACCHLGIKGWFEWWRRNRRPPSHVAPDGGNPPQCVWESRVFRRRCATVPILLAKELEQRLGLPRRVGHIRRLRFWSILACCRMKGRLHSLPARELVGLDAPRRLAAEELCRYGGHGRREGLAQRGW